MQNFQTAGTPAEYCKARDQVMHNAYARAIVDAAWLATEDMQPSIQSSGLEHYQQHHAQLRQDIFSASQFADWADRAGSKLKAAIRNHENTSKEFRLSPPMHRNPDLRLVVSGHLITRVNSLLETARENLRAVQNMAAHWKSQREQMLSIEPRLAAAITHYISTRQPETAISAPAPAPVNVTLQMPAEFRISSMPARRTTSNIERDADGNITAAYQLEMDAA